MAANLHEESTIIDGLIIANWGLDLFRSMRDGGITAANCTCSVWEDFPTSMKAIAQWKQWFRDYQDLIIQIYDVDDIARAKREGKAGVILGWQNSTGFGDHLPLVAVYHELGLRIVQLTYNTANTVGSGCYETHDGGLTDFGHDLVEELNRVGILIDLSHVGPKTSSDVISFSRRPVTYSHCLPSALKNHPRNKSDEQLREIAEKGGFVGVTFFPPFLKRGTDSTVDDLVDAVEHVSNIVGEDRVGIGTDFTQGQGEEFFRYLSHDKGFGRKLVDFGEVVMPKQLSRIEDIANLTAGLVRRRWGEGRIRNFMGENWVAFLEESWAPYKQ
jgi:membrane dipeptidase